MKRPRGRVPLLIASLLLAHAAVLPAAHADAPAGQVTWAIGVSLPPAWFDPADATGILIPFMVYYALHDALAEPMPGKAMAPSLAESWSVAPDGLSYEFVLRQGVRFHNGDPLTADDVKFSFERYRGVSAKLLKERVRQVQVVDPLRVRFVLEQPWPGFLTFYIFRGPVAEEVRRTPGLTLRPVQFYGEQWLAFTDQWDPISLWADRRIRLAVNHAIDRQAGNQPLTLGFSRMTGSIIPRDFEFAWPVAPYPYDARKARQLLAEAGYPNGFEVELWTDTGFADQTEAVASYLTSAGIRTKMRALERAAYVVQLRDKKLRPLVYVASAAYGNAATRLDSFVAAGGLYAYGSYPDIGGLIQEQVGERDRKRRESTLHRIQQLVHERAMFAPIWDIASLHGYGPRVAEPGLGLIGSYLWSGPYEDVKRKGR